MEESVEAAVVRAIPDRRGLFIQDHRPDLPARQREVLVLEYFGFEADEIGPHVRHVEGDCEEPASPGAVGGRPAKPAADACERELLGCGTSELLNGDSIRDA
jgi:hypothetical protein